MNILKVIHGFPPDYMAGSEVYSYYLVKALLKLQEDVTVFTSVENEFDNEYTIYNEIYNGINVQRINKFRRDYSYQDKFYDINIDAAFRRYLNQMRPDVVHFGHLSHLSTGLLQIAAQEYNLPTVFTIHDFWLFCVKGQLINQHGKRCNGCSSEKCHLCSPYQITVKEIQRTLKYMRGLVDLVDLFLAPSHTLRNFFIQQGVPENKVFYSKYGFDKSNITFKNKQYTKETKINFAFMGRIIPNKGIKILSEAFQNINATLSIYGNIGSQKRFLEKKNIHFKGGYDNHNINQVLHDIDVLIVPSIWLENSPLVIQEAFLAGVPVIASNIGGMKELVTDCTNGFLFEAGNMQSLKDCVLNIINNPLLLNELKVSDNVVRCITDDAKFVQNIYRNVYHKNRNI